MIYTKPTWKLFDTVHSRDNYSDVNLELRPFDIIKDKHKPATQIQFNK